MCVVCRWNDAKKMASAFRAIFGMTWVVAPVVSYVMTSLFLPATWQNFGPTISVSPKWALALFVLALSLCWREFALPWLQTWHQRRLLEVRILRQLRAAELARLRKESTRLCRNCSTPYKDQDPPGGRFCCQQCGHVSRKPMLGLPGNRVLVGDKVYMKCSSGSLGAEVFRLTSMDNWELWETLIPIEVRKVMHTVKIWLIEAWYWWALFCIYAKFVLGWQPGLRKGKVSKEKREESAAERAAKVRRKSEERKLARLEREMEEEEERQQREEVARLVEVQRKARQREEDRRQKERRGNSSEAGWEQNEAEGREHREHHVRRRKGCGAEVEGTKGELAPEKKRPQGVTGTHKDGGKAKVLADPPTNQKPKARQGHATVTEHSQSSAQAQFGAKEGVEGKAERQQESIRPPKGTLTQHQGISGHPAGVPGNAAPCSSAVKAYGCPSALLKASQSVVKSGAAQASVVRKPTTATTSSGLVAGGAAGQQRVVSAADVALGCTEIPDRGGGAPSGSEVGGPHRVTHPPASEAANQWQASTPTTWKSILTGKQCEQCPAPPQVVPQHLPAPTNGYPQPVSFSHCTADSNCSPQELFSTPPCISPMRPLSPFAANEPSTPQTVDIPFRHSKRMEQNPPITPHPSGSCLLQSAIERMAVPRALQEPSSYAHSPVVCPSMATPGHLSFIPGLTLPSAASTGPHLKMYRDSLCGTGQSGPFTGPAQLPTGATCPAAEVAAVSGAVSWGLPCGGVEGSPQMQCKHRDDANASFLGCSAADSGVRTELDDISSNSILLPESLSPQSLGVTATALNLPSNPWDTLYSRPQETAPQKSTVPACYGLPDPNNHQTAVTASSNTDNSQAYPMGTSGYPTGTQFYPTGTQGYPTGTQFYPTGTQFYPTGTQGYPVGTQGYPRGTAGHPVGTPVYPVGSRGQQVGFQVHTASLSPPLMPHVTPRPHHASHCHATIPLEPFALAPGSGLPVRKSSPLWSPPVPLHDVVPPEFVDCITQEVMVDPVITADGHSYDRSSISAWLRDHDTSPLTGQVLPRMCAAPGSEFVDKTLRPNLALRSQILEFRDKLLRGTQGTSLDQPCDDMWRMKWDSASSLQ